MLSVVSTALDELELMVVCAATASARLGLEVSTGYASLIVEDLVEHCEPCMFLPIRFSNTSTLLIFNIMNYSNIQLSFTKYSKHCLEGH